MLHSYNGNYSRLVSGRPEFDSLMELMAKLLALLLFFEATAYAPNSAYSESAQKFISSRYVNGDSFDAWGLPVSQFTMACGLRYHGYIFVFKTPIPENRIRYCTDSVEYGIKPGRIDIAITEGTNDERIRNAFIFGRKRVLAKLVSATDFLECRGLDVPQRRIDIHHAVISQLYVNTEECL